MRIYLEELKKTTRTKVKRSPKRAVYDRETIYKILDETFVCHVAFKSMDKFLLSLLLMAEKIIISLFTVQTIAGCLIQ